MFNLIKFSLLCVALGAVLLPISAAAQCSRTWDASGIWQIRQGRTLITLDLKQSGSALSGAATRDVRIGTKGLKGDVTGDADGDAFSIVIDWSDGGYSAYRAQVSASGKLEGEVLGRNAVKTGERWYAEQPLTCGWTPGKNRGDLTGKPSATSPVKPGQGVGSRLATPFLAATTPYFPPISRVVGQSILQWDAGPDHPNAELWVKYGGGRERVLFVKQPKGGQPVEVVRGQVYTYVLMDGRRVLASTVVVGQ